MKTQTMECSSKEIAERLTQIDGHVVRGIVSIEEPADRHHWRLARISSLR
jgi:hypothetical protein